MKIERINQNQIRCTLYREDLEDRELHVSELAFGSDKAQELFRDMLEQAADELGFESEDTPLMIEAIPASHGCLVLLVTKADTSDDMELDDDCLDDDGDYGFDLEIGQDDFIPLSSVIKQLEENASNSPAMKPAPSLTDTCKCFSFTSLDNVLKLSHIVGEGYNGRNALYKQKSGEYILVLYPAGTSPQELNHVCSIASEFGQSKGIMPSQAKSEAKADAMISNLEEHGELVCGEQALQNLASI